MQIDWVLLTMGIIGLLFSCTFIYLVLSEYYRQKKILKDVDVIIKNTDIMSKALEEVQNANRREN